MKGISFFLPAFCLVLMAWHVVLAQQSLPSMTVTLSGGPETYEGTCPVDIRFKGAIHTVRPARVHYKFIRSDGAYFPTEPVQFETEGAREVTTTWTVGTGEQSRYEGWMALRVVYPGEIESDRVRFKVLCTGMSAALPDLAIEEIALDDECRVTVAAKNVGKGSVFDQVWTDHVPDSAAIALFVDGEAWGREMLWLVDPQRTLRGPGGRIVYRSNLRVKGTQTIRATIDGRRQVKETNEGNNEKTVALTCSMEQKER